MKTKVGIALAVFALSTIAVVMYAADASPLAGSWATDSVADVEMPKSVGILGKMAASAISGGNTSSSIGNSSGTPTFTGPTVNNNRSRSGGGPSRGGPGGANDREDAKVFEEPPIMMEFKVDAKGKLTGSVTEVTMIPVFARKDLKIEEGTVTDKKFEFKTIEKSEKVSNTTRWVGVLTDEKTITLERLTKGGNPIDGSSIVFHRAKK